MKIVVQKYGGTSVSNLERIKEVAVHAKKMVAAGFRMVIIVSAMSGTTNSLVHLIDQVTHKPNLDPVDFILSTGEYVSAGLLSIMLGKIGVTNTILSGWQVPVCTSSKHTKANIEFVRPHNLKSKLLNHCVLIITGFQGVDSSYRITTLGRGGSDTSAVAVSAALSLSCQICTDVKGIYTADPRLVGSALVIPRICFEEAFELASFGSKVMHDRSLLVSGKHKAVVTIKSSFLSHHKGARQTVIFFPLHNNLKMETSVATSLSFRKKRMMFIIRACTNSMKLLDLLRRQILLLHSKYEIISCFTEGPEAVSLVFNTENHNAIRTEGIIFRKLRLNLNLQYSQIDVRTSELSVVGLGLRSSNFVVNVLSKLTFKPRALVVSELRITMFIQSKELIVAINKLHFHLFE